MKKVFALENSSNPTAQANNTKKIYQLTFLDDMQTKANKVSEETSLFVLQ